MNYYQPQCEHPKCNKAAIKDCDICKKSFCLLHINKQKSNWICLECK